MQDNWIQNKKILSKKRKKYKVKRDKYLNQVWHQEIINEN